MRVSKKVCSRLPPFFCNFFVFSRARRASFLRADPVKRRVLPSPCGRCFGACAAAFDKEMRKNGLFLGVEKWLYNLDMLHKRWQLWSVPPLLIMFSSAWSFGASARIRRPSSCRSCARCLCGLCCLCLYRCPLSSSVRASRPCF